VRPGVLEREREREVKSPVVSRDLVPTRTLFQENRDLRNEVGDLKSELDNLKQEMAALRALIGHPATVDPDYTRNTLDTGLFRLSVAAEARDAMYKAPLSTTRTWYTADPALAMPWYLADPILDTTIQVLGYRSAYTTLRKSRQLLDVDREGQDVTAVNNWPVKAIKHWILNANSHSHTRAWAYLRLNRDGATEHTLIYRSGAVVHGDRAVIELHDALRALQEITEADEDIHYLKAAWSKYIPEPNMELDLAYTMFQYDPEAAKLVEYTLNAATTTPSGEEVCCKINVRSDPKWD
jgi:hypothetical protein